MAPNSPFAREPVPVERPTSFAELEIQVGPATPWGTAKGKLPPDQASYFVMTFGALGCVVTGVAGSVLTLRVAPGLTVAALAELALALITALIIAVCGIVRELARPRTIYRQGVAQVDGREGGATGTSPQSQP